MQEISSVISGSMQQNKTAKAVKSLTQAGNFLNVFRSAGISSQLAILEKGSSGKTQLHKKQEIGLDFFETVDEEDQLLGLIANLQNVLEEYKDS